MDLNAVRMFVAVVQSGSLSAAAARTHVPLPTVSRRIRDLEGQLKVRLFERSTRGTRLTDAGSRLYEYAIRGIEALADGEQAVRSDQATLKGRLRLSIPPSLDFWWSLLQDFQRRHPDIRLNVYTTERRVDLIEEGIDVALRLGDVADESLVARRIASYRHLLVASPALVAKWGEPQTVNDLYRYPCAAWAANIGARGIWRLGREVFEPRPVVAVNDYMLLRSCAVAGEVMTELPPFLAAPFIANGALKVLLKDSPLPEVTANLLYPSHRYTSTIVRAYLDFCKDHAAGHFSAG